MHGLPARAVYPIVRRVRWVLAHHTAIAALAAGFTFLACSGTPELRQGGESDAEVSDVTRPDAETDDGEDVRSGPDATDDVSVGDAAEADAARDADGTADVDADAGVGAPDADAEVTDVSLSPWQSVLFPDEWVPHRSVGGVPGLVDFSYAGYAAGLRREGPSADATVFAAADFGLGLLGDGRADPEIDATASIQAAVDAAAAAEGGIVQLPPGQIRVDDVLSIQASGVVLRGAGSDVTELVFTRSEGMSHRAHLTIGATPTLGPDLPLTADADIGAVEIRLAAGLAPTPGAEVVLGFVITPEFVEAHGMNGTWGAFNETWQPFAWRTVVDVREEAGAAIVTLDVPLREPHLPAHGASVRVVNEQIRDVGVESLAVSNAVAWDQAWANDQVHAIAIRGARDAWVRDVRSFASPSGEAPEELYVPHLQSSGVLVFQSRHVTIRDVHLANAQHRGGGGNGYLFEIRQSNEILTVDSTAARGRHNFIQNWGFGTSGCVWLRVESRGSAQTLAPELPIEVPAASEFHHSLATANLIDDSLIDDGWYAENRGSWSSGAGITAWRNVFWNVRGHGEIRSRQFGHGYVIGTAPTVTVSTDPRATGGLGTAPEDWVEGEGRGHTLVPSSLYEAQLDRRRDD